MGSLSHLPLHIQPGIARTGAIISLFCSCTNRYGFLDIPGNQCVLFEQLLLTTSYICVESYNKEYFSMTIEVKCSGNTSMIGLFVILNENSFCSNCYSQYMFLIPLFSVRSILFRKHCSCLLIYLLIFTYSDPLLGWNQKRTPPFHFLPVDK